MSEAVHADLEEVKEAGGATLRTSPGTNAMAAPRSPALDMRTTFVLAFLCVSAGVSFGQYGALRRVNCFERILGMSYVPK